MESFPPINKVMFLMEEIMRRENLRVCDFCLRSEVEVSPIRLTGDDEGLQVCIDCEPKYNTALEPTEHAGSLS